MAVMTVFPIVNALIGHHLTTIGEVTMSINAEQVSVVVN
ncbi:hypothetical protein ACZ87_02974 [Candidatus Erwinia dacicola]|uniref:Uncharacterized protein n=1 Tax=Candidatus Erwinia dacicola TaxID=252393 RepID=A0A328TR37_9GAMM|nr:hypothetical protein ACZ87_02974 [Candidatus Erwinia dacicola]